MKKKEIKGIIFIVSVLLLTISLNVIINKSNNFKDNSIVNENVDNHSLKTLNEKDNNKKVIIKKILVSSTFTLKATFIYIDYCLKEKNKKDNCFYKNIDIFYNKKD